MHIYQTTNIDKLPSNNKVIINENDETFHNSSNRKKEIVLKNWKLKCVVFTHKCQIIFTIIEKKV